MYLSIKNGKYIDVRKLIPANLFYLFHLFILGDFEKNLINSIQYFVLCILIPFSSSLPDRHLYFLENKNLLNFEH